MSKRKVLLYGTANPRVASFDDEATNGATIGMNLRLADGTLVTDTMVLNQYVSTSGTPNSPATDWSLLTGKPTTFPPSAHAHVWGNITGTPITLLGYGITDATPLSHVGSGGAGHANAIPAGPAGFMTGADKTKLDGIPVLASGTYTPTLTNVSNLDASTAYACQYLRVGSTVTVSGKVDLDPTTTATLTRLGITLPVASNFTVASLGECAGTASSISQSAIILADITNDRAEVMFTAVGTANTGWFFSFTYRVA